jgi:hypothetical protein
MDLEIFLKQYDNTLTEYTQLNSEYLTYIKNTNEDSLSNDLISVDNSEYSGTGTTVISEIKTDNVEACRASCSSTSGCSGATYNLTKDTTINNCVLKSGDGQINIKENYSAIVTKKMDYLNRLKILNDQLINLNTYITTYNLTNKPDMLSQLTDNQNAMNQLSNNLSFLVDSKDDLDKEIKLIKELDGKIQEGSILANMNYSIFNVLLVFAIIIIIIFLYTYAFSDNTEVNNLGNVNNNGSQGNVINNIIFFVILFICGFMAWINKTSIQNWFKKYFYNSS